MRYISLQLIFMMFLFASCSSEGGKKDEQDVKYYYLEVNNELIDTIYIDSLDLREPDLQLESKKDFLKFTRNKNAAFAAIIHTYINSPAPVDGENRIYWEPHVGIFYQKNLSWPIYRRLRCTNDSIDNYISMMIDHILLTPELIADPWPPSCFPAPKSKR